MRLGQAVALIPWPVIEGFTLGIAVIIFLQQVPAAVGVAAGARTMPWSPRCSRSAGSTPRPLP
nr:SulP family inorganic anion transporter [Tessaracoccus coleopterorum]